MQAVKNTALTFDLDRRTHHTGDIINSDIIMCSDKAIQEIAKCLTTDTRLRSALRVGSTHVGERGSDGRFVEVQLYQNRLRRIRWLDDLDDFKSLFDDARGSLFACLLVDLHRTLADIPPSYPFLR